MPRKISRKPLVHIGHPTISAMIHTTTKSMILPFDWNALATPEEKSFLEQHGLRVTDPIDMYMEFRSAGYQTPNSDGDFGQFFDFMHTHLEALYEAMGFDDSAPVFGHPGLTAFLVKNIQWFVNVAWRWGNHVDQRVVCMYGPHTMYVGDSAAAVGHSGVHVQVMEEDPMSFGTISNIPHFMEIASQMEATAGTTANRFITPAMVAAEVERSIPSGYETIGRLFMEHKAASSR